MVAPGASVHSIRPLTWLLERGSDVLFVDDTRPAEPDGRAFRYAPYPLGATRRLWLGWRLSYQVGLAELKWLARRFRPDIVHVHWVDHRAVACADAGLRPLVFTVWGSDVNRLLLPGADATKRRQIGGALAKADLVFADSPDMPDEVRDARRPARSSVPSPAWYRHDAFSAGEPGRRAEMAQSARRPGWGRAADVGARVGRGLPAGADSRSVCRGAQGGAAARDSALQDRTTPTTTVRPPS